MYSYYYKHELKEYQSMSELLSRIDLNLLVAFQVLLEEQNVTRAAERLFITQPAMSKTLGRLRDLFHDDLFTRSSYGLSPTPRALELKAPLVEALDRISNVVNIQDFDPSDAEAEIRIGSLGTSSTIGIPDFIYKLKSQAPRIQVINTNLPANYKDLLRSGSMDFAIFTEENYSQDLITHKLMSIRPAIYMRKHHPLANNEEITEEEFFQYQHVISYFPNFYTRNKSYKHYYIHSDKTDDFPMQTPHLMMAMETIKNSDFLLIASRNLREMSLVKEHFVMKPLKNNKFFKKMRHTLQLIQHNRTKSSLLHQWLTKLIVESFSRD